MELVASDKNSGEIIESIEPVTLTSVVTHTYTGYDDVVSGLEGNGTPESPFLIKSYEDLVYVRDELIHKGHNMWGISFKLTTDIDLPLDWVPIGTYKDPTILNIHGDPDEQKGQNIYAFMGMLDGDGHTVTIAEGGMPLFRFVADAVVKNLNIYGKRIASAGLVSNIIVNYGPDGDYNTGCPKAITVENVTLKNGSSTYGSGLIDGNGSGVNSIDIINCKIEDNVVIGYTGDNKAAIGSFVGELNGSIINSVSYADIKGQSMVGGMAGRKGQSMGGCKIASCAFYGTIEATGTKVGGILGAGYEATSAPNTPVIFVQNCVVVADIKGGSRVGGIVGSEGGVYQAWNDGAVTDNVFIGTVTATDPDGLKGGIMGFCNSLNSLQVVANNYYLDTCGASKGIGDIKYIDTSCSTHEATSGAIYFDSSKSRPMDLLGHNMLYMNLNRTDDPLGADKDKLAAPKSAAAMKDGSVVKLLNSSETSLRNWMQGKNGPRAFQCAHRVSAQGGRHAVQAALSRRRAGPVRPDPNSRMERRQDGERGAE